MIGAGKYSKVRVVFAPMESAVFSAILRSRGSVFLRISGGMGTRSSLQNDLISKNIKALSAFYLTDGDNQWIQRIIHTGNDCLNFCDDISGSQNRIDTLMRGGTMRRNTLDFNSEIVTAAIRGPDSKFI